MEGRIKWWDKENRYGFIVGDDGQDVFLHYTKVVTSNYVCFAEGDRVSYDIEFGEHGLIAKNVVKKALFNSLIKSNSLPKTTIESFSIDECKEKYELLGDEYKTQVYFSINNSKLELAEFVLHIIDKHIELITYFDGISFTKQINYELLNAKTSPLKSEIKIGDHLELIVMDDNDYNTIVMLMKYADYMYMNGLAEKDNPIKDFKEIDVSSVEYLESTFEKYFSSNTIQEYTAGNVHVIEFDDYNNIELEQCENTVFSVGIYTLKGQKQLVSYSELLDKPGNLMLFIETGRDRLHGIPINNRFQLLTNENNYELYISSNIDRKGGCKIEFYNYDKYKTALAYVCLVAMYKQFPNGIQENISVKKVSENINYQSRELDNLSNDNPYEKLNNLIGLSTIKEDVNNLINLMKIQIRRKEQGLKPVPVSLHLVFSGNPGTGKTTLARILADVYKDIGILSKGQLVEVDRSGLVAGYVGQTAIKTKEKIEEALGGILFIDEAYTLVKGENDYGQEAIDTILKAMEDYRDDFIVIVAGYDHLMQDFINSNPGLRSRFNKYICFPDYNANELVSIFCSMCNEYQYTLTEDAKRLLKEKIYILEANKSSNFANARDIRNMFEKVIINQATRLSNGNADNIMEITVADLTAI